jgi:hypothetical protein
MSRVVVLFNRRFHCRSRISQIKAFAQNHHIISGRKAGCMPGLRCIFSKPQRLFIAKAYRRFPPPEIAERLNRRFRVNFKASQVRTYLHKRGITSGRNCCFQKGRVTWNCGTKGTGICKGNKGNFKKGHIPANLMPFGSEWVNRAGYVEIKTRVRNPYNGNKGFWRPKHQIVWEKKHGKMPKGSCIIFLDGNNRNFRGDNLACITHGELARLNQDGYPRLHPKLKPAAFAVVKLKVKMFEKMTDRQKRARIIERVKSVKNAKSRVKRAV